MEKEGGGGGLQETRAASKLNYRLECSSLPCISTW